MPGSTHCRSRKEDQTTALLLVAGAVLFLYGFKSGWSQGRKELLVSLDRAQRIATHLNKEQ